MYEQILSNALGQLKSTGQYRRFTNINRVAARLPHARLFEETERDVIVWCSNDYLGMSAHPSVLSALVDTAKQYGAGSGGSRNIGGNSDLHVRLEKSIAEWHDKEAALTFPTGYVSNDATLQCLLRLIPNMVVFSDANNHASIINGIRSTHVEKKIFKHNDINNLNSALAQYPQERPKLVVFESVYSMDGDVAPIAEIVKISHRHCALTFIDEVHAVGIYGPKGAGMTAAQGVLDQVDIIQGTLAKGVGVIGGYIASTALLIDAVRSFASGFIFTTAQSPALVAAALTSIDHLKRSDYERRQLQEKTSLVREALHEAEIPVLNKSTTHILPVIVGDSELCRRAADRLLHKHGVYLQPINYPSVPRGTERFRVNATPNHTQQNIADLSRALREVFEFYGIPRCHNAVIAGTRR